MSIKEYPKAVYKDGKFADGVEPVAGRDYVVVESAAEEKAAAEEGFHAHGTAPKAKKQKADEEKKD